MISSEHHAKFEQALGSLDPAARLYQLATTLRDEGVSQIDLYTLFSHYLQKTSGEDPLYDAIADPMDIIHGGPWAKGRDLYPEPLTEESIKSERKVYL
jgi:hypothetical protein